MAKKREAKGGFEGTEYPGVFVRSAPSRTDGKTRETFYIKYLKGGRQTFEKAEIIDANGVKVKMTARKAADLRSDKMRGVVPSNRERREAERAAKAAETSRWTVDKLWTEWKKVNADKKGVINDDSRYQTHLKKPFGDKEPREIAPLDLDRVRVRLLKTHAVGTVSSILSLFRRITSFGVKRRLCDGLPFRVELPKGATVKTEDMDEKQMAAYIKTCREWPEIQEGTFQLLMLYTGLRRSEVQNLKWSSVDFNRNVLHILGAKSGQDELIPLSDPARELLEGHPRVGEYVFVGERKGRRGTKQIAESSRKIRDAAGLPGDFRPSHGLRHTFASHLASSGEVDLYTLQRLLTHKSPLMTQRYAHLRDDALRRGANVMGKIIAQVEAEAKVNGASGE